MKSPMMKSSLPALATILLCFLVQAVQQGFQIGTPRTLNVSSGNFSTAIVFNLSLLASLPVIGAIGAALAKSLGHSRKAAVEAVISPVALVCAMLLALFFFDVATTRALVSSLAYSCGILVGWVVVPSAALLFGFSAGWKFAPAPALEVAN
jgi:hypothetical protein